MMTDLGGDGVRTTPIIMATASKLKQEEPSSGKRRRDAGDAELGNSSVVELRCTRRRVATRSKPPAESVEASVERVADGSAFADLTGKTESAQLETLTFSGGIERSRTTPLTDLCASESMSSSEANSQHKSAMASEMPAEWEMEELLSAAEKDLEKRFSERYNFDIVRGVPLEGRYEWARMEALEYGSQLLN